MTAPTGRAKVRDVVVGLLIAGVPAVAGRVYRSRVWPISPGAGPTDTELPALLVFATPETKRLVTVSSVDQHFTVSCDITVLARAYPPAGATPGPAERLEATLEDMAGAIEDVVLTAPELIGWDGAIERIAEVRTELMIEPGSATLVGSAGITITMEWSEVRSVREPITCESPTVALGFPELSGL